jgi:NAD+ synthase
MLNKELLLIDPILIEKKIRSFIKTNVNQSGLSGAVVSLSGGIDSAVALVMTVKAIGADNVTVITMPECDITSDEDLDDVMRLAERLNVTCDEVEISKILHVIYDLLPKPEKGCEIICGNIKARLRMLITYYYANMCGKMVIGTSNKSELLTGFFTKYGDGGVDILPLADLYKTQIRQLAFYLQIPNRIIKKPPSPGFWPGQTDEKELGISYDDLDLLLYGWENDYTYREICDELKLSMNKTLALIERVNANKHKRQFPLILRLT